MIFLKFRSVPDDFSRSTPANKAQLFSQLNPALMAMAKLTMVEFRELDHRVLVGLLAKEGIQYF